VHGAKGLEAPLVLLLDTDVAAARAQTMGMLVDWPGESAAPRRFAFLASESHPPACCVNALALENQARQREELNGLYVAMTRARRELVISSVAPRSPVEGSWWRRLQPLCQEIALGDLAPRGTAVDRSVQPCQLAVVPSDQGAPVDDAAAEPAPPSEADDDSSRLGQALHRMLEYWPSGTLDCPPALRQRVAHEFRLAAGPMDDAIAMAVRIVSGEGAWAWDVQSVDWSANEVEMRHEGETLRLDRLVHQREQAVWWVLDYKSAARPERDAALLAQMRRYRRAVGAAYPGAKVMAAFLTGQGRLVVID
jgi:ATP-dependent helicase/nuclease subunit A